MGEWVGIAELMDLFGVSRQRVGQIVATPSFPAPAIVLQMGRIWRDDEVREWARARNRHLSDED